MFALDGASLARYQFLDCASGASAFGAQLRARAGNVISADPLYSAGWPPYASARWATCKNCEQWLNDHADVIDWRYLDSPSAYRQAGLRALDLFSQDFAARPDMYLAPALPRIPLTDNAVDVALCANFLFAYADSRHVDFHVAAIIELARVARHEVLIHPMSARDGSNLDEFAAAVKRALAAVFTDLGAGHFTRDVNSETKKRNHIRQLEALGYNVTLSPAA